MKGAAERPWFDQWFDRDYLLVYGHRDARDAARGVDLLVRALAPAKGARILDLACGPGRHAAVLAERGYRPIGLDLSPTLLRAAATLVGTRAALVRADMRAIPFAHASFAALACFFTSFGYFDEAGNQGTLAEMARVLTPGGGLLLDYLNRGPVLRNLAPESQRRLGSTFVIEARHFDPTDERLVKEIEIQDGSETRRRRESVRLYHPEEVVTMLATAGLDVIARFGDLDGGQFDAASSSRLVIAARHKS